MKPRRKTFARHHKAATLRTSSGESSSQKEALMQGRRSPSATSQVQSVMSAMQPVMQTKRSNVDSRALRKGKDSKPDVTVTETTDASGAAKKRTTRFRSHSVSPEAESAMATFMAGLENVDKLTEEFKVLNKMVPKPEQCQAFNANSQKNRYPSIACLDSSRVTASYEDKPGEPRYLHANYVTLEHVDRKFIAAQAPLPNSFEDFWKMVFDTQSYALIVLCNSYEGGTKGADEFWPQNVGAFEYYGTMFVNNKKVDFTEDYTQYTLEILPEGCSNSNIVRLLHITTWAPEMPIPSLRTGIKLLTRSKAEQGEQQRPLVIVSSAGCGRAGTLIAIVAACDRLTKGKVTNIADLTQNIRRQRAYSVENVLQYLTIYLVVANYIKLKAPKFSEKAKKFKDALKPFMSGQ